MSVSLYYVNNNNNCSIISNEGGNQETLKRNEEDTSVKNKGHANLKMDTMIKQTQEKLQEMTPDLKWSSKPNDSSDISRYVTLTHDINHDN